MDNKVKVTILLSDGSKVDFIAEADFNNDYQVYTEIAIDHNSEYVDFYEDKKENFYSTSLGNLLDKYQSVTIQKFKNQIV